MSAYDPSEFFHDFPPPYVEPFADDDQDVGMAAAIAVIGMLLAIIGVAAIVAWRTLK